jgi:hypothetical protein
MALPSSVGGSLSARKARDAVRDREIAVWHHLQVVLRVRRGASAPRAHVDDQHLLAARAPVDHAREQHRVHLRRVVAPEQEHVAAIEIVVAARRLVDAVGGEETGHGRRHAQPRVRIDVIRREASLHELLGRVTLGNRPLSTAIHREAARTLLDARGDRGDGLLPRDRNQCAALAQERASQPVLAVEREADVIALHAQKPAVHLGLGVSGDRHDLAALDAHFDVAAGAAEAAGRLVPGDPIGAGGGALCGLRSAGSRGGRGSGERCELDEIPASDVHGVGPSSSRASLTRSSKSANA